MVTLVLGLGLSDIDATFEVFCSIRTSKTIMGNELSVLSNYLYCFEFVPSQSPLFQSLSMSKHLLSSPQETVLALSYFTINRKSRHLIFISLLFTA